MKSIIIFLTVITFSITNVYSKEVVDCKSLKKFSLKSGKKSIFKKFGEAKSLSDVIK